MWLEDGEKRSYQSLFGLSVHDICVFPNKPEVNSNTSQLITALKVGK